MKTLLVLGAGRLNLPAARAMSSVARVIAVDRQPFEIIDEPRFKTVALDFSDQEALLRFAEQESVVGVYPFSDHAIRPAALLTATLGLVGLQGDVAENFLDKSRMREIWNKSGLSQPEFAVVQNLQSALQAAKEIGYPVIVKPASSGGGGRGVFRVDSERDLSETYPRSVEQNRYSDRILVEKFIVGVESSLELIVVDGQATLLAISTKEKAESKSQVATEIVYPGELSDVNIDRIRELCFNASQVLGLVSGVAHFEVITTPDGIPYLVEVGGRAGGGHTFHPIVSHVSGINYPELIACLYLRRVDDVRKILSHGIGTKGAVYSFPVTNLSGTIKSIGILETGVGTMVELWKKPGDISSGMNSSMDRLGCVVSLAENREAAITESRRTMTSFFVQVES
jgi:biotin carboxylase